jgi:anti-sigma regulatory factor (Ser/Thr protein kinase)
VAALTQLQSSPLTADQLTPARARHYVSSYCEHLPTDALDVVRLLTTELVSNALWHGGGDVRLDLQVDAHVVTVGVTDSGPGEVTVPSEGGWPEGRQGLRLVSALADRWGVDPNPHMLGKRVWFELAWSDA